MAVMSANDFIAKARDVAVNYKTLYVYGCFGSPMNDTNKYRYTHNYEYNEQPARKNKILNASYDTFGFDCVNLIKGLLWGWNGNLNATYGGAVYGSNGVPDTNANGMFNDYCTGKTTNFNNIVPGEFVWMDGHIGVYIGDNLVVECTPIWNDGVQITGLGNKGGKSGYATRTWTKHGKSKFLDYNQPAPEPTPPAPTPSDKFNIGDEVILNGPIYVSSNASTPANTINNKKTQITRKNPGSAHPYNTTGDLGWCDESSLTKVNSEPSIDFKVGDKVVPIELVDYDGRHLVQYDPYYFITELKGNRAVLCANRGGQYYIWAALNTNNLRKI